MHTDRSMRRLPGTLGTTAVVVLLVAAFVWAGGIGPNTRSNVALASGGVVPPSIDSISIDSPSSSCLGSATTGTVTLGAPWTGTITLIEQYSIPANRALPQTKGFVDTNPPATATATFTGGTTATYTFSSFVAIDGANSYRIAVYDAAGLLGSTTKSASVPACGPTTTTTSTSSTSSSTTSTSSTTSSTSTVTSSTGTTSAGGTTSTASL